MDNGLEKVEVQAPLEIASVELYELLLESIKDENSVFSAVLYLNTFLQRLGGNITADTKIVRIEPEQNIVRTNDPDGKKHVWMTQRVSINNPQAGGDGWTLRYVFDRANNTFYIRVDIGCGCNKKKEEENLDKINIASPDVNS